MPNCESWCDYLTRHVYSREQAEMALEADFLEHSAELSKVPDWMRTYVLGHLSDRTVRAGCPHIGDDMVMLPFFWILGEDKLRCWDCVGGNKYLPVCIRCGHAGVASYMALYGVMILVYTLCTEHDEHPGWDAGDING